MRFSHFSSTLLLAALAACGGATTSNGGGASAKTLEQATNDLASALCKQLASCSPFTLRTEFGGDVATCTSLIGSDEMTTAALPGTDLTPAKLEACAQAIAAQDCSALPGLPASCNLSGTVPTGGPCSSGVQCVADHTCNIPSGQCGTCQPVPGLGQPCIVACAPGLACVPTNSQASWQCVATVQAGGACDDTHPCSSSLFCNSGRCSAPLQAGAACTPGLNECDYNVGLSCGPSNTCTTITLAKVGEPCGAINGAEVECAGLGVTCGNVNTPGQNTPGEATCLAPLPDGAACGGSNEAQCTPPSSCNNGTCGKVTPTSPTCH